MMRIKEDHKNREIFLSLSRHEMKHDEGIRLGFHDGGAEVVKEIRRLVNTGSRTGRVYYFRGVAHQASAPGEPPRTRTGRLAKSADYKVRGKYQMTVGETAFYAKFLEEGTSKMAPRPHVITAVKNKSIDVMNAITDNVNRQIGI